MELTAKQKGDNLEEAVSHVENFILNSNPQFANLPFTIDTKKIFIIEGVKHEIDVYVEIDIGNGYKSIFIFECKNWKTPVNKNEIIIFNEKINIVNAQNGYFISKRYTKDAECQAKQYRRMELFYVTEEHSLISDLAGFHITERKEVSIKAIAFRKGFDKNTSERKKVDLSNCHVVLNEKEIDFNEYLTEITKKIIDVKFNKEPTQGLPSGSYEFEYKENLCYKDNLFLDGVNMEKLELKIKIQVIISIPSIKYTFDIGKRGRIIHFETKMSTGHKLELVIVNKQ